MKAYLKANAQAATSTAFATAVSCLVAWIVTLVSDASFVKALIAVMILSMFFERLREREDELT